jgi:hypothetical protein
MREHRNRPGRKIHTGKATVHSVTEMAPATALGRRDRHPSVSLATRAEPCSRRGRRDLRVFVPVGGSESRR